MTTSPVVSVIDELVAELEALASECGQHGANWYEPHHMEAFPEYACDQYFVVAASPATILALIAERAELKRDAKNYRTLRDGEGWPAVFNSSDAPEPLRGTDLDAAMQS